MKLDELYLVFREVRGVLVQFLLYVATQVVALARCKKREKNPLFASSPEVSGGGQRAPSLLLHQPGILA